MFSFGLIHQFIYNNIADRAKINKCMQIHNVNKSVLAAPHTLDCGQGAVAHQCRTQSASETTRCQTQKSPAVQEIPEKHTVMNIKASTTNLRSEGLKEHLPRSEL